MRRFLVLFSVFTLLAIGLTGGIISVVKRTIADGDFYTLDKRVKYLILGDSQSECSFNDTLISGSINLSLSAESYLYTYLKAQKIIERNPQIKTVFIAYSNHSIASKANDWIWDDRYLSDKYYRFAAIMSAYEYRVILSRNLIATINLESLALRKNLQFLWEGNNNYIRQLRWGAFLHHTKILADSTLLSNKSEKPKNTIIQSPENFNYLLKTILFLKREHIAVYLVRTPIHHNSGTLFNEKQFIELVQSNTLGADFLDFKTFPVDNDERADLTHLNFNGARKFSIFFNELIYKGLLDSTDKQAFINREMERLNKSQVSL